MPSRGEPVRMGPFEGGLNLVSDPSAIADNELVTCNNFEVDLDGSLITRPAITETLFEAAGTYTGLTIIGRGTFPGGSSYLFLMTDDSNGGVLAYNGRDVVAVHFTLRSSVAVQHGGFVWFVPRPGTKSSASGGRWDPINGFVVDANMPEGEAAFFHKSRMYIAPGPIAVTNPSRLQFSDLITSSTLSWTGTNIIDVSPGDGQNLIDMVIYNDNLLLFKNDSTYLLAFDTSPSDAVLRSVNSVIGVSTKYCVASYENSLFVLHQGKVYEMVNFDYEHINLKVPFQIDPLFPEGSANLVRTNPIFMSRMRDRLVVVYFNTIYVFGLKTRTWTTWSSTENSIHCIGPIWEMPTDEVTADDPFFVTTSNLLNDTGRVFHMNARPSSKSDMYYNGSVATTVPIVSEIETKHFDFADSHHFKKLFWWGVDIVGPNATGTVVPYTSAVTPLWSAVEGQTWSSLADNPWAQPLNTSGQTTTTTSGEVPLYRTFIKFLKTLRFRMIAFKVSISHSGSTLDGPVRLFTVTAIVSSKQTVGKQVN